jgi:hypothetical protein
MTAGQRTSDPIDQLGLVLSALKNRNERAALLFDPPGYALRKGLRLDPGFAEVLRAETRKINDRLFDLARQHGVVVPRIDDPRRVWPTELIPDFDIQHLPAMMVVTAAVCDAAILVLAVAEVYQTTSWRTAALGRD